jgi:peptidyl-prolyl cis-trans isomerase D
VIQLKPEMVVVIRMKSHIPSKLLPISEVQVQIADKLRNYEVDALARNEANTLLKSVQSGASISSLAAQMKLATSNPGYISRYSTNVDNAILDLAFRLPNPKVVNQPHSFGVAKLPNGYAVVCLSSIKDSNIKDQKQLQVYAEQIQSSDGLLEYELYKLSQTNKASIKIYQQ